MTSAVVLYTEITKRGQTVLEQANRKYICSDTIH